MSFGGDNVETLSTVLAGGGDGKPINSERIAYHYGWQSGKSVKLQAQGFRPISQRDLPLTHSAQRKNLPSSKQFRHRDRIALRPHQPHLHTYSFVFRGPEEALPVEVDSSRKSKTDVNNHYQLNLFRTSRAL